MKTSALVQSITLLVSVAALSGGAAAQQATGVPAKSGPVVAPAGAPLPADYVIGQEDVLAIVFWRDEKMGAEVTVRPDGRISLPLLNDVEASGLTPDELRAKIDKLAAKYVAEPNATVIVKAINSRKVHVVGNVVRAGTYPLAGEMNVLQLIALAGGLQEYADAKNITIIRKEAGRDRSFKFNYKDVSRGKNLQQNVQLKPGDTVVVP